MAVPQECPALAAQFHGMGRLFEEFLREMAYFFLLWPILAEGKGEACGPTAPLAVPGFPLTLVCFDADLIEVWFLFESCSPNKGFR